MYDLVMPNNNENVLLERAKKLGMRPVLVYEFSKTSDFIKKKEEFPEQQIGALIKFEGQKSIRLAKDLKKIVSIIIGSANFKESAVRQIASSKHFDLLIDTCSSGGAMHTHYQYSNVNQVTAKLASENEVTYCVNFSNILRNYGEKRALLMARMMQNIRIFKKYNVPVIVASFASDKHFMRNSQFFKALLRVLNYSVPKDELKEILAQKSKRRRLVYIRKGVRIID